MAEQEEPCQTILRLEDSPAWSAHGLDRQELRFFLRNRLVGRSTCLENPPSPTKAEEVSRPSGDILLLCAMADGDAGNLDLRLLRGDREPLRQSIPLSGDSLSDIARVVQQVIAWLAGLSDETAQEKPKPPTPTVVDLPLPGSFAPKRPKGLAFQPDKWLVQAGLVWQVIPKPLEQRFGGNLELGYFPSFRQVPLGLLIGAEIHPLLHERQDIYRLRFWQFPAFVGLLADFSLHRDVRVRWFLGPMLAVYSLSIHDTSGYVGDHRLRRLNAGFATGPELSWYSSIGLGGSLSFRASYLHPGQRIYFLSRKLWDEPGFSLRLLFQVSFDSSHLRPSAD